MEKPWDENQSPRNVLRTLETALSTATEALKSVRMTMVKDKGEFNARLKEIKTSLENELSLQNDFERDLTIKYCNSSRGKWRVREQLYIPKLYRACACNQGVQWWLQSYDMIVQHLWNAENVENIWHVTSSWRHQSMKKGQFLHICKIFSPVWYKYTLVKVWHRGNTCASWQLCK